MIKEISKEHRARFRKHANALMQLMKEIRQDSPDAEMFMEAEGGLYLTRGPISGEGISRSEGEANKVEGGYWAPGFGCGAF